MILVWLQRVFLTLLLSLWFVSQSQAGHSRRHTHTKRGGYDTGASLVDASDEDTHKLEFFKFVTRPDIDAPRWNVKVYNESALAPGYWFVASYEYIHQKKKDTHAWIGPHIYDGDGELIWSGAPLFGGYNIKDFRVASVDGVDMLTGVFEHDHVDVVIDSNYEVFKEVAPEEDAVRVNIHDFNTVENGTRALAMTHHDTQADKNEADYAGLEIDCRVDFVGFEEYDTTTWERTFSWNSNGQIHLNESYQERHTCKVHWDYLHANSIDKFPDGDYLLSGRNTDALYKISGKDGSIVWHLGGKNSDFDSSAYFSGQHDARVRLQNDTHTIISIMDNALDRKYHNGSHETNENIRAQESRALVLVLRTDRRPMTAEVLREYDHPHGDYIDGRGNLQILEKDNVFIGWWDHSFISEHTAAGKILMEAEWLPYLKSYRSYKFPWVGRPTQPPDVYSKAIGFDYNSDAEDEAVATTVYVSWNGATEVASWNLYKTTADGKYTEKAASMPCQGFETVFWHEGFASHVIVEALDRDGNAIGKSEITQTLPPSNMFNPAITEEQAWHQYHSGTGPSLITNFINSPAAMFLCGVISCATATLVLWWFWFLRQRSGSLRWPWQMSFRRETRYEKLPEVEGESTECDVTLVGDEDEDDRKVEWRDDK